MSHSQRSFHTASSCCRTLFVLALISSEQFELFLRDKCGIDDYLCLCYLLVTFYYTLSFFLKVKLFFFLTSKRSEASVTYNSSLKIVQKVDKHKSADIVWPPYCQSIQWENQKQRKSFHLHEELFHFGNFEESQTRVALQGREGVEFRFDV